MSAATGNLEKKACTGACCCSIDGNGNNNKIVGVQGIIFICALHSHPTTINITALWMHQLAVPRTSQPEYLVRSQGGHLRYEHAPTAAAAAALPWFGACDMKGYMDAFKKPRASNTYQVQL